MEAGKIIAIVDDDESVRESLSGLIESFGLAAKTFGSAEEYIRSGQVGQTVCAVLDIRLPGMSGLELQRLLTRDNPVPVVLISAHADSRTRTEALAGGAIDLLNKPFSDEDLLGALRIALERSTGKTPGLS
jgi:two-component system, LuxR family, response regulator FixJ